MKSQFKMTQESNVYSIDLKRKSKSFKQVKMQSYFKILSMSELLGENQKIINEIQANFTFSNELKMKSKLIINELKNRFCKSPIQIQSKFLKISKQHENLINKI